MNKTIRVIDIARACHEANRVLCESVGDTSQKQWHLAEEWQRESAVKGVEFALATPNASPDAQHMAWVENKVADGWCYGPVKDATAKTHPCIVPFDLLPLEQQVKDHLFKGIVNALKPLLIHTAEVINQESI